MKKFLSLLGVLIFIGSFQVYAEKSPVILDHYFTGNICYGTNKERWEKMYVAECCLACRLLPICTECIQRKIEVGENKCSNVAFRENAEANIRKFFMTL